MTLRLIIFFTFLVCISCKQESDNSFLVTECVSENLSELDINADIQILKNNTQVKLTLKKPYKTVDESQQKLLLDFLISCFYSESSKQNIDFIVALDKELGKYENKFSYSNSDVLKVQKKDTTLQEIHKYIVKKFDKKDMIVLNNFIAGFYNNYPYKEDIYNVGFLELLKLLKNEKNDSDKGKITFLLLYGTSKKSNSKDLKNIPKHLKAIWNMVIKSDIDVVLLENFE